jgi:hypothetical protein
VVDPIETEAQRDSLFAARRAFIRAYPATYAVHRWHYWFRTLGLGSSWEPVYTNFIPSPDVWKSTAHHGHHSLVQRGLNAFVRALGRTFLFWPLLYVVIGLGLVGFTAWRRRPLELTLLVCGLTYELVLFFTVTRTSFFDSHLLVVATIFAGAMQLARRFGPRDAGLTA